MNVRAFRDNPQEFDRSLKTAVVNGFDSILAARILDGEIVKLHSIDHAQMMAVPQDRSHCIRAGTIQENAETTTTKQPIAKCRQPSRVLDNAISAQDELVQRFPHDRMRKQEVRGEAQDHPREIRGLPRESHHFIRIVVPVPQNTQLVRHWLAKPGNRLERFPVDAQRPTGKQFLTFAAP